MTATDDATGGTVEFAWCWVDPSTATCATDTVLATELVQDIVPRDGEVTAKLSVEDSPPNDRTGFVRLVARFQPAVGNYIASEDTTGTAAVYQVVRASSVTTVTAIPADISSGQATRLLVSVAPQYTGAPGGSGPAEGWRSNSPRHVTERSPRMLSVASALS